MQQRTDVLLWKSLKRMWWGYRSPINLCVWGNANDFVIWWTIWIYNPFTPLKAITAPNLNSPPKLSLADGSKFQVFRVCSPPHGNCSIQNLTSGMSPPLLCKLCSKFNMTHFGDEKVYIAYYETLWWNCNSLLLREIANVQRYSV